MYLVKVIFQGRYDHETLEKVFDTERECHDLIRECPNALSWSIHPLFVQGSIASSDSPKGIHLVINVYDRSDSSKFDVIHNVSLSDVQSLVLDNIDPYEVREVRIRLSVR